MPTSVALGTHFETFIKDQIASGRYNNASEVVREGLRLLEDQKQDRQRRLEALRAEIQKGIDDKEDHDAETVFAEAKTLIAKIAKSRQAE